MIEGEPQVEFNEVAYLALLKEIEPPIWQGKVDRSLTQIQGADSEDVEVTHDSLKKEKSKCEIDR